MDWETDRVCLDQSSAKDNQSEREQSCVGDPVRVKVEVVACIPCNNFQIVIIVGAMGIFEGCAITWIAGRYDLGKARRSCELSFVRRRSIHKARSTLRDMH